jgi:hypothetical protein
MNLPLTINNRPYIGQAHPTQSGAWIYLKGFALPDPSKAHLPFPCLSFFPFTELFRPLPPNRLSGGFLEIGEWQNSRYECELPVDFYLAPDGSVWAKLCDTPESLPINPEENPACAPSISQADQWAFQILQEAEATDLVISTLRERAACGGWPEPKTPADFLAWIDDESSLIETYGDRPAYVQRLKEFAERLRDLGITPATLPWQQEGDYAQVT